MPTVEPATVPGAAHASNVDEPGSFSDALRTFAASVVDGDTVSV